MQDALVISPPRCPEGISGAAVLWQAGPRSGVTGPSKLRLTLVAKATYAWTHGGPMAHAAPEPIRFEDRNHGGLPVRSVEWPSETAPLLRACDVIFSGSAVIAFGQKALSAAARLAVFVDRRPVLDKTVHVLPDRKGQPEPFSRMPIVYERAFGGPGQDNPVGVETPNIVDPQDPRRPSGFGAISRFWRARKRLVETIDASALTRPLPEIAEDAPWAYFQAAPADQQIGYLRGGEWLVLDGLHPDLARVQTQVPFAQARGRVRAPNGAIADVPMVADMLLLAGDSMRASIVWRGSLEIPFSAAELPLVRTAVALEAPGVTASWDSLLAADAAPPSTAARAPTQAAQAPEGEGTLTLAPASQAAASARAVAPFEVKAAGTGRVTADVRATPWSAAPLAKTPDAVGEATLSLGDRGVMAAITQVVSQAAPPPSPSVPVGTFVIRPSSTPDSPAPPVPPPPSVPVGTFVNRPSSTPDSPAPAVPPPSPEPVATGPNAMSGAGDSNDIAPPPLLSAVLPETSPAAQEVAVREEAVLPQNLLAEGWIPPVRTPRQRNPNAASLPAQAIAGRLRSVGMEDEDVRDLLLALEPPPPPPDDA